MALDPTDADPLEEMRYGASLGLQGIKLYPVLAGFDPSDAAFDPFYAEAARLGLAILWHVGATPSPVGYLRFTLPLLIDEVARRHPGLRQVMAHMGHPWQRETITVIRKNRNVYSDISGLWVRPFDLLPAALRITGLPVIGDLLARRWSLIVCDEFQDTDEQQWKLLEFLASAGNRLLLLGDPNQMIYDKLPGRKGAGTMRLKAALARPGAEQVQLKLGSYRDPSQLLPAVAEAVRQRRFTHPALAEAIVGQRLRVLNGIDENPPADTVSREIEQAYAQGARTALPRIL